MKSLILSLLLIVALMGVYFLTLARVAQGQETESWLRNAAVEAATDAPTDTNAAPTASPQVHQRRYVLPYRYQQDQLGHQPQNDNGCIRKTKPAPAPQKETPADPVKNAAAPNKHNGSAVFAGLAVLCLFGVIGYFATMRASV